LVSAFSLLFPWESVKTSKIGQYKGYMTEQPTYEELEERIKNLEKEADLRLSIGKKDKTARKNYTRFLKFLPYPVLLPGPYPG